MLPAYTGHSKQNNALSVRAKDLLLHIVLLTGQDFAAAACIRGSYALQGLHMQGTSEKSCPVRKSISHVYAGNISKFIYNNMVQDESHESGYFHLETAIYYRSLFWKNLEFHIS